MKPGFPLLGASLAALLSIAPPAARAADDPQVAALISQSGAALHVDVLHPGEVIHARGSVTASGLTGSGDDWNEMGGLREAALFSTPPLGGGTGWDGDESWTLDQTGLVIVDGSVLGRSTAINQAYFSDYDLWTPDHGGATVTWGGSQDESGKRYDLLTVTPPKSSLPMDIWFDAATHLPVKAVQVAGPLVTTMTLADFRPVQGLLVPYRVEVTTSDGDSTVFTAASVEADPPGAAAHLAAPTSAPHDFSIAGGADQAVVPVRIEANHVYIDVMLDGKGPFHFIFDSGGANVVDTAVVKALGVASDGSTEVTGVGSESEGSSFALIKTLQVGDAVVKDQVFIVLPIAKSLAMAHGLPMDGVIGYEVLSRFLTTFDYADSRIVFHMPGSYTVPPGATVVPIQLYGTQPQFACGIDGVPATCALDTGSRASVSLFTPFVKAHPEVIPAKLTEPGVNGFGVGGAHLGTLGRLRAFSIGGLTLHDMVGDYTTQTKGSFALPFMGANIGGAVWKRFTMTLDYRTLTMTLVPDAAFTVRDHWDRSGLFLIDKGGITVIDARPGTPAAKAGLKKGDVIVSLDGSSKLSLAEVRDALLAAPGTVVHLVIKARDGATRDVALTLADYV